MLPISCASDMTHINIYLKFYTLLLKINTMMDDNNQKATRKKKCYPMKLVAGWGQNSFLKFNPYTITLLYKKKKKKKPQQPSPTTYIRIKAKIFSHCFSCLLCKCWENVFIRTESKMTAYNTYSYIPYFCKAEKIQTYTSQ